MKGKPVTPIDLEIVDPRILAESTTDMIASGDLSMINGCNCLLSRLKPGYTEEEKIFFLHAVVFGWGLAKGRMKELKNSLS
jgi:hypothetical protein